MSSFGWRALAVIFLGLGLIGLVLPVVPQIPFLLLGAAAAAKGWPWLDERLVAHPVYGPLIVGWRERRAIPFRAKVFCMLSLAMATLALFLAPVAVPGWLRIAWLVVAVLIAAWVARRPVR
jgi:uncharacterized membrane protein YbaN (DUF454 family)